MHIVSLERVRKEYFGYYTQWRYAPHREWPLETADSTMLTTYNVARGVFAEIDLRAAYVKLFTEPLPVEVDSQWRIWLSPADANKQLPPIGVLEYHDIRVDWGRFMDIREVLPDDWLCMCDWREPYPEPPWEIIYRGGRKCGFALECKRLEDCLAFAERERITIGCIRISSLFKYGALVAIGLSAKDMGYWFYTATRALSLMLSRVASAHAGLYNVVVDSIRAPAAAISRIEMAIDRDIWPYKRMTCDRATYDYAGLICRRCESESLTDYRLWVVGEDLGVLRFSEFASAARRAVYEGDLSGFPSAAKIVHLFEKPVTFPTAKPLECALSGTCQR